MTTFIVTRTDGPEPKPVFNAHDRDEIIEYLIGRPAERYSVAEWLDDDHEEVLVERLNGKEWMKKHAS